MATEESTFVSSHELPEVIAKALSKCGMSVADYLGQRRICVERRRQERGLPAKDEPVAPQEVEP